MTEVQHFVGKVKWFNPRAGYGFITRIEDESDVFVHHSGLKPKNECFKTLYTGEYVEMEITTDENGKHFASNVTGMKGCELMCERYVKNERSEHTERSQGNNKNSNWSTQGRRRDDRRSRPRNNRNQQSQPEN